MIRNQNQSGFIPVLLLLLGLAGILAVGVGGYKYLAKNKVKNIPQVAVSTQEPEKTESSSVSQETTPQVAGHSKTTPEVKTIVQTQKLSTEQVRLAVADEMKALLAQGLLQGPKGEKGEKGDSYAESTRGTLGQGQHANNLGQVLGISTSSPAPLPQYAPIFYNPGNAQILQPPTSSIGATSITADKASFTQSATIANLAVTGSCSGCGDALAVNSQITGATAGSVLFAGSSGVLSENNAKLFWDNTNNYLGIGTSSPGDVASIAYTATTTGPELLINGSFTGGSNGWVLGGEAQYSSNQVVSTYVGGDPTVSQTFNSVAGEAYLLEFTVSSSNAPLVVYYQDNAVWQPYQYFRDGTHKMMLYSTVNEVKTITFDHYLYRSSDSWTLDNVSLKKVTSSNPTLLSVKDFDGRSFLTLGGTKSHNLGIGKLANSSITSGSENVAVGNNVLGLTTTGNYNTGIGNQALYSNGSGSLNTAIGYQSLFSNTTGGYNIGLGLYSLYANVSGSVNTAIGYNTMSSHVSGDHNIAMGYNTLSAETGGASNVVIGNFALRTTTTSNRNTVVGYGAMETLTPGTDIVAMGYQAGGGAGNRIIAIGRGAVSGATIGDNNIGVGYGTLTSASGANNLALGYQAGNNSITGSANIIIGYDVDAPVAGSSNQLTIGNLIFGTSVNGTGTSVSTGSIGIGITSASIDTGARLHVSGSQRIDGGLCIRNATACPAYSAGRLYVDTAGTVGGDDPGDVFDIAEMYAADSVSPGDVIIVDPLVGKVKKTTEFGELELPSVTKTKKAYTNMLGVVSTRPAITIAGHYVITGPDGQKENADLAQVALAGRVPVKVSTENGEIQIGDYLTSSKLFPGYAMKATRSGEVIGQALEPFIASDAGKVLVFLKPGYQVINNTFTLEPEDGQLTSQIFKVETNNQDTALLVNQKGSGNLLTLQRDGADILVVGNKGTLTVLNISDDLTLPVLSLQNQDKKLFVVYANGNLEITGNIKVAKDTAGTAVVKTGDNRAEVVFQTAYQTIPKITLAPVGSFIPYFIEHKTEAGFTIVLKELAPSDISFDWIALEQPQETQSNSKLLIKSSTPANPESVVNEAKEQTPEPVATPEPEENKEIKTDKPTEQTSEQVLPEPEKPITE